jgi:hypothetical protein
MEVTTLPNRFRPGVGLAPSRVAQRPWLPQHARLCPVLEAGSALGYLVYAPLRADEAFQVTYADRKYQLTYVRETSPGQWENVFRLTFGQPAGGTGIVGQELALSDVDPDLTERSVCDLREALIFPHHLGVPAGGVGLRAAVDFRTPPGWDTVYGPVVNHLQPPFLSGLTVRVETDWYAHDTEFRYVLQPGDTLQVSSTIPIGQVFFVPREEITLREATSEDVAHFNRERELFDQRKASDQLTAPYGLRYSPLYQKLRKGKTKDR